MSVEEMLNIHNYSDHVIGFSDFSMITDHSVYQCSMREIMLSVMLPASGQCCTGKSTRFGTFLCPPLSVFKKSVEGSRGGLYVAFNDIIRIMDSIPARLTVYAPGVSSISFKRLRPEKDLTLYELSREMRKLT